MQTQSISFRLLTLAAGALMLAASGWAIADPPSRVARLGYMRGDVSFSPAGEDDWMQASINRPLTTGDRLWSDRGARAELQLGGAMIRMGQESSVALLNLDDRTAQVQLTQGRLNVRVRRLERGQVLEIDTPNLAFSVREPAEFRIDVDPDGYSTTIAVRRGQGEAYGEGAAYVVDAQQAYRFTGTDLDDYEYADDPGFDEFDRWSVQRDRRYDSSASARYVSRDVVGYQDLDDYGRWRRDPNYGNVWIPNRVSAGWAPYHDGHWAWIDPWGWTWVDDAPWGFAVSHYGRWANLGGTWGWVPGPTQSRAYYAPALVMFVGGNNFQLSLSSGRVGGVAWFPLGPREVYQPSYRVSRGYFENVNRSNTVINNTVINNYYTNSNVTNVVYMNRQVPGAVVAVPRTAFVQSQPVSRAAVRVSQDMIAGTPVAYVPPVAPTDRSVRGANEGRNRPQSRAFERPVIARSAPPPAPVGFAAQERQLSAQPGKPLDDNTRKELKRERAAAPVPVVKVVAPTGEAPPTVRPPPVSQAPGQRGKSDKKGPPDQRGQPVVPPPTAAPTAAPTRQPAPVTQATPPQPVAPPAAAPPPEQHGKADKKGPPDQRGQPVIPPPTAAPTAAPTRQPAPVTQATPPQPVAPPAAAPPPEQHGKADKKGPPDQRGQPVAPPPTAAPTRQPTPVTQAAPPQPVAPPAAAPPPQQQHGKSDKHGPPDQRGQPIAPPPAAAAPKAAPEPQAVPPPPVTSPAAVAPTQAAPAATPAPAAAPEAATDPKKGKGKKKKDGEEPVPDPENPNPPE